MAFCAVATVLLVARRPGPPRRRSRPACARPGGRRAVHLGRFGIIHVNSGDDQSVFTLGQFFDAWQVALGPRRLGGLQATRRDPVTVYLNGSRVKGPPGSVMLTPHQEIAVTCRPGSGLRGAVPAGYAFPSGT